MEKVMCIDKVVFWTSDDILYCKLVNTYDNHKFDIDIDKQYQETLHAICNGHFLPLIIDLRALNFLETFEVLKQLAKSKTLKHISLSEAIVVNTLFMKLIISFYKRFFAYYLPFKIVISIKHAKTYCNETNKMFNII